MVHVILHCTPCEAEATYPLAPVDCSVTGTIKASVSDEYIPVKSSQVPYFGREVQVGTQLRGQRLARSVMQPRADPSYLSRTPLPPCSSSVIYLSFSRPHIPPAVTLHDCSVPTHP